MPISTHLVTISTQTIIDVPPFGAGGVRLGRVSMDQPEKGIRLLLVGNMYLGFPYLACSIYLGKEASAASLQSSNRPSQ
jgi:hypothetical protein